ncbi:MAG TPA: DUF2249 domain-containing protein [Sulfuricurvum sp.]|nr:DUF2249 domain-containing protein [Sulfuricurvum sp.]
MILLDTREYDHPTPLEMAVDTFKTLNGSEVMHMIHRREPLPLFEIVRNQGGRHFSYQEADGIWHIFITRDPELHLEQYRV